MVHEGRAAGELRAAIELRAVIEDEHLREGEVAVDKVVFGTAVAAEIAAVIEGFCERELGARVAGARFYRVSAGCVAGLDLEDGRAVVIKAQQGGRREAYLAASLELRALLADGGFPCPRPLSGPRRAGPAWITAEELTVAGEPADAHEPAIRRAIAAAAARIEEVARRLPAPERLGRAWFMGLPADRVFPRPHSARFDFDATRDGAEWIEMLAAEARSRRGEAAGERAVGHFDLRAEHLRFEGDRLVATHDWDSVHHELVPVWIGALAPHFTADWQRDDLARAPSIDEMRAFVADVEVSRGRPFTAPERATLAASCVYGMAYTARCNHASSPREEGWNGDLRPLLRAHGRALLDRGL